VPESFVFSPDGRHLYGSSYYTGVSNIFRYEVSSGDVEAVSNAELGYFRPVPLADGRLIVFHYSAAGFAPALIEPRPLKDVSAITFLGAEVARLPSGRHDLAGAAARRRGRRIADQPIAGRTCRSGAWASRVPIRCCRATSITPASGCMRTSMIRSASRRSASPRRSRPRTIFPAASAAPRRALTAISAGMPARRGTSPTSTTSSVPRSAAGAASRWNGGYDRALIYDEPRRLDLKTDVAYYHNLDALPEAQNIRATSPRLLTAMAGLYFTNTRKSRGAVDDEKGVLANAVLLATTPRAGPSRSCAAGWTSASRCRSAIRRCGCATPRRRARRALQSVRELLHRRLRQQLRRRAR